MVDILVILFQWVSVDFFYRLLKFQVESFNSFSDVSSEKNKKCGFEENRFKVSNRRFLQQPII